MISKGKLFFSWAISTSAGHSWEVYQHACKTRAEIKYHIQLCWFQPHSLIYGVKYLTAHEGNLRTVLTVTTLNIILPFLEDWKLSVRLCLTYLQWISLWAFGICLSPSKLNWFPRCLRLFNRYKLKLCTCVVTVWGVSFLVHEEVMSDSTPFALIIFCWLDV